MRFVKSTVILGAMIGAGFASGAELAVFFARFGYFSLPMIVVSGVALCFVLNHYLVYVAETSKNKSKSLLPFKRLNLSGLMDYIIAFNSFIILSGMLAGADEAGKGIVPFPFVSLIVGVLCYFVVLFGLKGIARANVVLVPLVVASMLVICFIGILKPAVEVPFTFSWLMLFNPILYPCFNLLLAVGAIKKLKVEAKDAKPIAVIVAVVTTLLMLIVVLAILIGGEHEGMPVVRLATSISHAVGYACYALMLFAILTSMFASSFTLLVFSERFIKNKPLSLGIILCIGWMLSRLGFSNIIVYLYPILGGIGVVYFGGIVGSAVLKRRLGTP